MYYKNKIKVLADIFGADDISLEEDSLKVNGKIYPIVNDVIIITSGSDSSAEDIQYTFKEEWKEFDSILPEHKDEFARYFDIVDIPSLNGLRLCDLGCGNGRWSYFLKDACRELVLVDFSDAIFVARKNLAGAQNCLFFKCGLKELPFRDNFADFLFCIGVLHHLPTPALEEVRRLKRSAPRLLIYLYYSLDNKPAYFGVILKAVTFLRLGASKIRNTSLRAVLTWIGTVFLYLPLIYLGKLLRIFKLSGFVPLYETYHDKTVARIRQDVYDRFFTRIEQRVSRKEILELKDTFSEIIISDNKPYWHFLLKRDVPQLN